MSLKINIDTDLPLPQSREDMVGNVYPVRGGFGARNGHAHVIISYYDTVQGSCRYNGFCTVTVDNTGQIVGANNYATHYFENKIPIARVEGLEDVNLVMRSI